MSANLKNRFSLTSKITKEGKKYLDQSMYILYMYMETIFSLFLQSAEPNSVALRSDSSDAQAAQELQCPHMACENCHMQQQKG